MYLHSGLARVGVVLSLATIMAVSGCSSSGENASQSSDSSTSQSDGLINIVDVGDTSPVDGGELSFGSFAEPGSLDPARTTAALTTGGIELLNIYDSLMQFDNKVEQFVPRMAESLGASSDYGTWTMTLRDGVKFSNGDPVDAAAVKFSQERYVAMNGPEAALWKDNVASISIIDPKTVKYELKRSWPEFPGILSTGPGMIVAKESIPADGEFIPIGAGPFTLASREPTESMTLSAREEYWGGPPHVDRLRFAYLPNATVALETMLNGGIDATFVRDPGEVARVTADGIPGNVNMTAAQFSALINASEGRPGADPRVRRAMQLALDSELVMSRAFGDAGEGSSTIFPEYSRWHTGTAGLPHDQEEAKLLVEAAKADGFDGRIEYVYNIDPASQQAALAFESLLESAGFEVEVKGLQTVSDLLRVVAANLDYDVAKWGLSYREADPFPKMFATMHSSGKQVYGSFTSPDMDALMEQLQESSDPAGKLDIMDQIQRQVNADVPYLVFGPAAEVVIWNRNVVGPVGTSNSMVFFDKAWKNPAA